MNGLGLVVMISMILLVFAMIAKRDQHIQNERAARQARLDAYHESQDFWDDLDNTYKGDPK